MTRYIYANVGRHNIFRQWMAFVVVLLLAPRGGRRGWCEIDESDGRINEPKRLLQVFPTRRWKHVNIGSHTPITYPISEKGVQTTSKQAAEGRSGGWPHKKWVMAQYANDVTQINGHMPPGAFNNRVDRLEQARKEEWNQMWNVLVGVCERVHERGQSIIVHCDANRQGDMPKPHPRARLVAHHKTDYMWAIPAKGKMIKMGASGTRTLGIDFHKAIYADVSFVKA